MSKLSDGEVNRKVHVLLTGECGHITFMCEGRRIIHGKEDPFESKPCVVYRCSMCSKEFDSEWQPPDYCNDLNLAWQPMSKVVDLLDSLEKEWETNLLNTTTMESPRATARAWCLWYIKVMEAQ